MFTGKLRAVYWRLYDQAMPAWRCWIAPFDGQRFSDAVGDSCINFRCVVDDFGNLVKVGGCY